VRGHEARAPSLACAARNLKGGARRPLPHLLDFLPHLFAQALAGMEIEQERDSVVLDPLAVVEIELEKERRR
jgi:hypothetical protein